MFDDQNPAPAAPVNLPLEPDDMFAGVEKASAEPTKPNAVEAGMLKKTAPVRAEVAPALSQPAQNPSIANMENQPMSYTVKEPILGKIILIIILLGILGGLAYGAWWAYENIIKGAGIKPVSQEQQPPVSPAGLATSSQVEEDMEVPIDEPIPTNTTGTEVNSAMNNDEILFGEPVDSDSDGLDDVREEELKTDKNSPDTDNDGLKDGDEVLIWNTDPQNTDSDGDGFLDGQEVRNGYNPLGPGKLELVPKAATSTVSSTTNTKR